MKRNLSGKNLLDLLLAVLFVSWCFFGTVIVGNRFEIFAYGGFSGTLIVAIGETVPFIMVYVFLTVWGDVNDIKSFIKKLFSNSSIKAALIAGGYAITVLVSSMLLGKPEGKGIGFIIPVIIASFFSGALAEVFYRGILHTALWERIPFLPACVVCGFIKTVFYLPLWMVQGTRQAGNDFSQYLLYCVYEAILLGCLFRLTESVIACVIIQCLLHALLFYYDLLILGTPKITLVYIVISAVSLICAVMFGKIAPGRGWK